MKDIIFQNIEIISIQKSKDINKIRKNFYSKILKRISENIHFFIIPVITIIIFQSTERVLSLF